METPPLPKDICDLIIANLPDTLTPTQKTILSATCRNLADDYVTPNELYNAVRAATPVVQQFFSELQIETFLKDTFQGYSEIWVPVQFALFIGLIFVVTIILIFTGTLTVIYGLVIILLAFLVFTILGIAEMDSLVEYLSNRESSFRDLVTKTFDKYQTQILLDAGTGYMVGGSLGIHSPNGLFNPATDNSGPFFINISGTTPGSPYELNPPYSKLTLFKTNSGSTQYVRLFEEKLELFSGSGFTQMLKPSYPKIIYIVNNGPGNIMVQNASATWTVDNNDPYTADNVGTGVTVASGQCRCFMNVNYTFDFYSKIFGASVSTSNWVLVS